MKKLFFILINSFIFACSAHDHPSVHGMLIVGKSQVYLSHLPMFHSPHNYQVIIEVEFDAMGKQIYLKNLQKSDEKIYTLVPEVFVLPEIVKNKKSFLAQIYQGHFERDGKLIADKVKVEIKRVIFYKKFNPKEIRPENGNFLIFGNEHEKFIAHVITTAPDFDQVLKIEADIDLQQGHISLVINTINDTTPINLGTTINSVFPIKIKELIYLEKGDLSL